MKITSLFKNDLDERTDYLEWHQKVFNKTIHSNLELFFFFDKEIKMSKPPVANIEIYYVLRNNDNKFFLEKIYDRKQYVGIDKKGNLNPFPFNMSDVEILDDWIKGEYIIRFYINKSLYTYRRFYIDSFPKDTTEDHIKLSHIKLYNNDPTLIANTDFKPSQTFEIKDLDYLWIDCRFLNIRPRRYYCEIKGEFYDADDTYLGAVFLSKRLMDGISKYYGVVMGWKGVEGKMRTPGKYKIKFKYLENEIFECPFQLT